MQRSNPPTLTEFDVVRLEALFERLACHSVPPPTLPALERELERAVVVRPAAIPASVVTMNSRVEVEDLETGTSHRFTLVFPSMARIDEGRLSVLAPLGLALLGSAAGSRITWQTPGGPREMRIDQVIYQPEAAGHFDL